MASLRCTDVQTRPTECLDLTSLTLEEFPLLVPPFEVAFQAHMTAGRLDGQPRTARRFSVYQHCPLAPPDARLFFLLTSRKPSTLQVVQGRRFGMRQRKAKPWSHVLLPALLAARRPLGAAPPRSLTTLAPRRGVAEADAALAITPLAEERAPVASAPVAPPGSPLWPMTGRNGASSAPRTLLNRPTVRAARNRTTRAKRSCWSTLR